MSSDCPFCTRIAAGEYDDEYDGIVHFQPPNPVVPGHLLVVPKAHVTDALENPRAAGQAMAYAADLARSMGFAAADFITSAGNAATQTVRHLHCHVIPRRPDDGLRLP